MIIVVWLNAFVEICTGLFMLAYGPTYIRYVLGCRFVLCSAVLKKPMSLRILKEGYFSVERTGFFVAILGGSFLPARITAGLLSDRIKFVL